jgi:PAS domain S-box-containing protein
VTAAPAGRSRICIVDDEALQLRNLAAMLDAEHEVLVAGDGLDAIDLVRRELPDLVLLDLEMPGLGGLAVCRALKADPLTAALPVVILTVRSDEAAELAGLAAGASDFITKPPRAAIVRARVRNLVRLKQQSEQLRRAALADAATIECLRQTEQALRSSEAQLALALRGAGLVRWDWRSDSRAVRLGAGWPELLGLEADTLTAKAALALVHPQDLTDLQARLAALMRGDTPVLECEFRLRHAQGHWVWIEGLGKVMAAAGDDGVTTMVGTLRDISQRRRLRDEGAQLLGRIEALIRESVSGAPAAEAQPDAVASLTRREREILGLVGAGLSSRDIGAQLHLSVNTVVTHRRNLMVKLDLRSTADLTRFAVHNDLVPAAPPQTHGKR